MEVENIGNWLYFLFIIIAGISSLFSSKKKGKRIQQKEGTLDADNAEILDEDIEQPEKGFWDILQEIQEQSSTKEEPLLQKKQIHPLPQEERKETESQKQINTQTHLTNISTVDDNTTTDIELTHASELRKAVIYSEILNRKY
jgi:cell shape-determining protein MreC